MAPIRHGLYSFTVLAFILDDHLRHVKRWILYPCNRNTGYVVNCQGYRQLLLCQQQLCKSSPVTLPPLFCLSIRISQSSTDARLKALLTILLLPAARSRGLTSYLTKLEGTA